MSRPTAAIDRDRKQVVWKVICAHGLFHLFDGDYANLITLPGEDYGDIQGIAVTES